MSHFITVIFLVVAVTRFSNQSCMNEKSNPCHHSNYFVLNDTSRSSGHFVDNGQNFKNDYTLTPGWYRSVSPAGEDMPMSPPEPGHCQTSEPIWMYGDLPSKDDGIVSRTACVRRYENHCISNYSICVKDCGDFRVYHLPTPEISEARYCFGSKLICPQELTFEDGSGPNCVDPCSSDVYKTMPSMEEGKRLLNYKTSPSEICDRNQFDGETFYRMNDHNGKDFVLPERCVEMNKCGTNIPIWLNDEHPKSNMITSVKVCTTGTSDKSVNNGCCKDQWNIDVKLCYNDSSLGYYVYKIKPPNYCDAAYCAMSIDDLWSKATNQVSSSTNIPGTRTNEKPSPTRPSNMIYIIVGTVAGIVVFGVIIGLLYLLYHNKHVNPKAVHDRKEYNIYSEIDDNAVYDTANGKPMNNRNEYENLGKTEPDLHYQKLPDTQNGYETPVSCKHNSVNGVGHHRP